MGTSSHHQTGLLLAVLALLASCQLPISDPVPVPSAPTVASLAGTWSGTMSLEIGKVAEIVWLNDTDYLVTFWDGTTTVLADVTWGSDGSYLRQETRVGRKLDGTVVSTLYHDEKGAFETVGGKITVTVTAERSPDSPLTDVASGWTNLDEVEVKSWYAMLDRGYLYGATEFSKFYLPQGAVSGPRGTWWRRVSVSTDARPYSQILLSLGDTTATTQLFTSDTEEFSDDPDSSTFGYSLEPGGLSFDDEPACPYFVTSDYLSISAAPSDTFAGAFTRVTASP